MWKHRYASLALVTLIGCDEGPLPVLRVGTPCPAVVMREVNDHWIASRGLGDNAWELATYYIGNLAAHDVLGELRYLDHAFAWAEHHDWKLNRGTDTRNADDHAAGQVYLQFYDRDPDPALIADIAASIDNVIDSGERSDWSWIDAQFMASSVFAHLGEVSGNPRYTQAMFELYTDARDRRRLYDTSTGLWFRDGNYLYPGETTPNGEKIFWSRGNGWVIASLVRTLEHLDNDSPYRSAYIDMLVAMSSALAKVQRADGLWTVSLADPEDWPGPESSGTAFFIYAIAWGINQGHLDPATFLPVVERGWRGLVEHAVRADGELGLVQGVGERPNSSQPVSLRDVHSYGVGAFLLAGSEMTKLGLDLECTP